MPPVVKTPNLLDADSEAIRILKGSPLLREKIRRSCNIKAEAVEDLFSDVLRFLACAAWHKERITPTKLIDEAWHEFILFTRVYGEFCEKAFGRFIHHTPDSDEEANRAQFRTFESLYAEAFPGHTLFKLSKGKSTDDSTSCGGCEATHL